MTDEDVRRVQEEARSLVRASALARTRETSLSARSISEFARVNRVEGLALGVGVGKRFGDGVYSRVSGRFGFDDHEPKGEFVLGWERAWSVASQWPAHLLHERPAPVPTPPDADFLQGFAAQVDG